MENTILRGSEWSASAIYNGWRRTLTLAEAVALGHLAHTRFHELAELAGSTAFWLPGRQEVISHDTPEQLIAWRKQARQEILQALAGNGGPMVERVTEILNNKRGKRWDRIETETRSTSGTQYKSATHNTTGR